MYGSPLELEYHFLAEVDERTPPSAHLFSRPAGDCRKSSPLLQKESIERTKMAVADKEKKHKEIVGDLIIVNVETPEANAKQELRKRGFIIACVVKDPESYQQIFSVKCGPKLIVHVAVEQGLEKKKPGDYASHELARIAMASMEVISRMKKNKILLFSEILLQHKKDELERATQKKPGYSLTPNVPDSKFLNQYYGSQVALYFTWAKFYTKMLIYPGLLGLLLSIWQFTTGSLDSPLIPIFTLLVALWGTVFLELWKRHQVEHAHEWKTLGFEEEDLKKQLAKKIGMPHGHNHLMYFLTVPINILVVYVVMRLMLYFVWLYDHAEEVYGEDSWHVYVPSILYSIVPVILKNLYIILAKILTEMEQHPTKVEKHNHLLMKMFGFNFINSYIALFYIAFWLRDLGRLNQMLMSIVFTRAIMEQTMDFATPILKRIYHGYQRLAKDTNTGNVEETGSGGFENAVRKASEPGELDPQQMNGSTTDRKLAAKLKKGGFNVEPTKSRGTGSKKALKKKKKFFGNFSVSTLTNLGKSSKKRKKKKLDKHKVEITREQAKQWVYDFYKTYNPSKLDKVDEFLDVYSDDYRELLYKLQHKYLTNSFEPTSPTTKGYLLDPGSNEWSEPIGAPFASLSQHSRESNILTTQTQGTNVLKAEENVSEDESKGSSLDISQKNQDSTPPTHTRGSSLSAIVSTALLGKKWNSSVNRSEIQTQLLVEIHSDKYNIDMEYLDLVIQFGYVSMFAVAFPLAPLLAILKNVVKLGSDYWNLTNSQRPPILRRSNIGFWHTALNIISIVSVLTNCGLMVMLSTYVDQYVPDELDFLLTTDFGRVFVAMVCEHVLIATKFLIAALIEDEPWRIQQAKARDLLDKDKWAAFGRLLSHKLKVSPTTELDINQRLRAEAMAKLGSDYRSPYAFGPMYYLPLLALPYGIAYFELSILWVFPLGLAVLSYLQRLKNQSDVRAAVGIVSDTQVMKLVHKEMPAWFVDSDMHRVDWWNNLLQQMWHHISEYFRTIVTTTVQEGLDLHRPKIFPSMKFSEVSMGSIAPKVTGVRVYDCDDEALRIDIEYKWAGNAQFALKIGYKAIAFHMELSNIHLVGKIRVELSPLISQFPCFGNISFTCLSRPRLDFTFKVFGLNLMALGIGDLNLGLLASNCVKHVVETMFLYPHKYVYNILPGNKIGGSAFPIGIVQVNIKEGRGLKAADLNGKSDPFVEAYVVNKNDDPRKPEEADEILKTDVIRCTLNPKWTPKKFNFVIIDTAIDQIYFKVKDQDFMTTDFLGFATLTLPNLQPGVTTNLWLDISEGGKLNVEALYLPLKAFDGHGENPAQTQDVLFRRERLTDEDVKQERYEQNAYENEGNESDDEDEDWDDSNEQLMKEISSLRENAPGSIKQCNLMKMKVTVSKLKLAKGRYKAKPTILAKYGKLTLLSEGSEEADDEGEDEKAVDNTKYDKYPKLTKYYSTSIHLEKVKQLKFFVMDLISNDELGHVEFEDDEVTNAFLTSAKASFATSKKASKGELGVGSRIGLLNDKLFHPKKKKTHFRQKSDEGEFGEIAVEITADREEDVLYSNVNLCDDMIEMDSTKLKSEKRFSIAVVSISEIAISSMKLLMGGHKQELFNPYVRMVQGSTVRVTKPAHHKEEFQWPNVWNIVINELTQATIQFEIKNDKMGEDPTIGTVVVTLNELMNSNGKMETKRSIDDKTGNLLDRAELGFKLELRTYEGSVR